MSERTRVALIGAGHVTQFHLRAWRMLDQVDVVAVVDPDRSNARRRAQEFGVPGVFSSLDEALAAGGIDVLDIASPPSTHAEVLHAAFDHGVDAVCQKPLCTDYADAVAIAHRARHSSSIVMVNDNWRYRSWYRRLKDFVDNGRLGSVFHASSSARFAGTIRSSRHPDVPFSLERQPYFADLERFILLESAIHQIDALRSFMGTPESVHARGHSIAPDMAGEDAVALMLGFGHATALVDRSYASHALKAPPLLSERVRIEGSGGTAIIDETGELTVVNDASSGRAVETFSPEHGAYQNSYTTAFRHFLDARAGREALESTIDDSLETLAVVFAGYESMAADTVVRVADFVAEHGEES